MLFDPLTVMSLTVLMAATTGLLLLFSWTQNRDHVSLALWGLGNVVGAAGAALLMTRNAAPDFLSINVANAVLLEGYAFMWAGSRAFGGRSIDAHWLVAGPLIWLIACSLPSFYESPGQRVLLASLVTAAYTIATARELWKPDGEHLISRYPTVAWLVVHALFYLGRAVAVLLWPIHPTVPLTQTAWFEVITGESLIHVVAVGFLFLSMAKERSEEQQRKAAETDALTGAASRRAFLDLGERQVRAAIRQCQSVTLLLLDLDHFKRINDSYGHDAGDRVLRAFVRRAKEVLRPGDLFGRIGGEEFAALLVDATPEVGFALAERFREAIERMEHVEDGAVMDLSVSIGVASEARPDVELGDLLKQADRALYAAKDAGRNRVHQRKARVTPLLRAV